MYIDIILPESFWRNTCFNIIVLWITFDQHFDSNAKRAVPYLETGGNWKKSPVTIS